MWRCGELISELGLGGLSAEAYRAGYSDGYYGSASDPGKYAGRGQKKYGEGFEAGQADKAKTEKALNGGKE